MKVFISWSGKSSRAVAEALHWWLPLVIQGVKPFVSAKDIDKGANWAAELAAELESTEFGLVCVTPENLISPWLNYEAGAISRSVSARVCPVLHGVQKEDVKAPLTQLQMTDLELDDVQLLMASMNAAAGNPLKDGDLQETVKIWWPKLRERLDAIAVEQLPTTVEAKPEPPQPVSTADEKLEELLVIVRKIQADATIQRDNKRLIAATVDHRIPLQLRRREFTQDVQRRFPDLDIVRIRRTALRESNGIDHVTVELLEKPSPDVRSALRAVGQLYDLQVHTLQAKPAAADKTDGEQVG